MQKNKLILFVGVVGIALFILWKRNSEGYCNCTSRQGGRLSACGDQNQKNYLAGLTENSDLAKIQKQHGGAQWSTISPGDYAFPCKVGCGDEKSDVVPSDEI